MAVLRYSIIILNAVLLLGSCSVDEIGPQLVGQNNDTPAYQPGRVVIINEGNFGRGNASLDLYQPASKELRPSVYRQANEGLPLGDVAQDLQGHQAQLWCVLNNSGSIKILDSANFELLDVVEGLNSPQYLKFNGLYAFATDLYQAKLWKIALQNIDQVESIALPRPASDIAVLKNQLFLAAGKDLLRIGASGDRVEKTWRHPAPVKALCMLNDSAMVYFSQDSSAVSALYQIPQHGEPALLHRLPGISNPHFLQNRPGEQAVFFIANDQVYRLATSNGQLESIYPLNGRNIYGMEVDPRNGDIYLADALDFNQNAEILRLDAEGQLLDAFKAGFISNGFFFRN